MSALIADHEQLIRLQTGVERGADATVVFECYVRALPPRHGYLVAAGLEQVLQYLKSLSFSDAEFAWLISHGSLSDATLEYARTMRFEGDVDAMPEGSVFFAGEPILRITAPLPMAQFVETRIVNLLRHEVRVASGAARLLQAARGRSVVDFGLKYAPGPEAALLTARASYLAGFAGTSSLDAARRFGVPVIPTLAAAACSASNRHDAPATSPEDEWAARVEAIRSSRPVPAAVRFDGAFAIARATAWRPLLDRDGLDGLRVFVSGALDEDEVAAVANGAAPIDGFCLTDLAFRATQLDMVYAAQHESGRQVFRVFDAAGRALHDVVAPDGAAHPGTAQLVPVMRQGRRVLKSPSLDESRLFHRQQLACLPPALLTLDASAPLFEVRH